MQWKDSYSVGVPVLDDDHKRLIGIINQVNEGREDGDSVSRVLHELAGYARFHFRREEARLKAANYPKLVEHKKEHKAFIEWLESVEQSLENNPTSHRNIAVAIRNYLELWLTNHILINNIAYKGFLT